MKRILLVVLCILAAVLLCACASNQDAYKAGYEAGLAAAQAVATPKPTPPPTWRPSPTPKPTQKPSSLLPYVGAYVAQSSSDSNDVTYILNKNTKKFHYPDCSSVYDMKESNKIYFSGTRDEAISQGYVPCKRCNP